MTWTSSRRRSTTRSRLRAESVHPAGFWKFGIKWANLTGASVERRLELVQVKAVLPNRHRHEVNPLLLEQEQRAVIGRLFRHHSVTRLKQVLEQNRRRIHRAVRDHHLG